MIGKLNPDLLELGLSGLCNITDDAICKICSQASKLVSINISQCAQLTVLSLQAIVALPKMRNINVSQCSSMDSELVSTIQKQSANILIKCNRSNKEKTK